MAIDSEPRISSYKASLRLQAKPLRRESGRVRYIASTRPDGAHMHALLSHGFRDHKRVSAWWIRSALVRQQCMLLAGVWSVLVLPWGCKEGCADIIPLSRCHVQCVMYYAPFHKSWKVLSRQDIYSSGEWPAKRVEEGKEGNGKERNKEQCSCGYVCRYTYW